MPKKVFNLARLPLIIFDTCPNRELPDVMGIVKEATAGGYIFRVGPGRDDTITVMVGSSEPKLEPGSKAWLQYSGRGPEHKRYWGIRLVEMSDAKYFPINAVDFENSLT